MINTTHAATSMNIPPQFITTGTRIRTAIDTKSESFKGLVESIRQKGLLEPILVTPMEENHYRLVTGERRLIAAKILGFDTIPARIMENISTEEAFLTLQLIENLQREDLDPLDEAVAYFRFFQLRQGDMDLNNLINTLINYERGPERVGPEFTDTVSVIRTISGKSPRTITRHLTLIRLPDDIKISIKKGEIGKTQGYIFAEHIDNPRLLEIFHAVLDHPVNNDQLQAMLKKETSTAPAVKSTPFTRYSNSMKRMHAWVSNPEIDRAEALDLFEQIKDLVRHFETVLEDGAVEEENSGEESGTHTGTEATGETPTQAPEGDPESAEETQPEEPEPENTGENPVEATDGEPEPPGEFQTENPEVDPESTGESQEGEPDIDPELAGEIQTPEPDMATEYEGERLDGEPDINTE